LSTTDQAVSLGLQKILVSRLLFDRENPRLPPDVTSYTESDLLLYFESAFDLLPVAKSLVDNGYFEEEPLIGIPGPNGKVIVVEGNRRLAALNFLTSSNARSLSKRRTTWEALVAEAEQKNTLHGLLKVPIVVHKAREELRSILGFRHITGIKRWDALQKNRFINHLIETRSDATFEKIGREAGSRETTIRNNYLAFRVYLQAGEEFNIDTSRVEKEFGVFYTALTDPNIRDYLNLRIEPQKRPRDLREPVTKKRADELRFFIECLHGTKRIEPVVTDSRQIKKLGEVLVTPEARRLLEATRDLEQAFRLTGGEKRALAENLQMANIYLGEAYKTVHLHSRDLSIKNQVEKCVITVRQILKSFPDLKINPI